MRHDDAFQLLPTSQPYARLDGGVRPPRLRVLLAAAAVIGLLVLVALPPRLTREPPPFGVVYTPVRESSVCGAASANPEAPPVEYGLMVDAGSTGSRIHVYRFNHCTGRGPQIEHEIFEQLKPGLSTLAADPLRAARSLRPLMQIAMQAVPSEMHLCTGVQVKATAGLRILGTDGAARVLDEVVRLLRSEFPFPLIDSHPGAKDAVAIMDGADEGVFAWITINSLLETGGENKPTATIMDLGGASTQIVFEPSLPQIPNEYRANASFSGRDHLLYQHSYLRFGLKEALRAILKLGATPKGTHPCYAAGTTRSLDTGGSVRGAPDALACAKVVNKLFDDSNTSCTHPPCSWHGVHHPPIPDTSPIYAFSYFYDLLSPVLRASHSLSDSTDAMHATSLSELATFQRIACTPPDKLDQPLASHPAAALIGDMLHEDPEYCAGVTYLGELLRRYRLSDDRKVTVMKKIRGYEMGWCLGATMSMLDAAQRAGGRCPARPS